jgi:hypothetical protein
MHYRMTQLTNIRAPWSLHFDRDGTEDVAIICDAEGHDLVVSRHFWFPEADDSIPPTLAAVKVMFAAPKLLAALIALAAQAGEDCPMEFRSRHFLEALEAARDAIEATKPLDSTGR